MILVDKKRHLFFPTDPKFREHGRAATAALGPRARYSHCPWESRAAAGSASSAPESNKEETQLLQNSIEIIKHPIRNMFLSDFVCNE